MCGKLRQTKKGQGVIEYSGALVIAAVIVSAALVIVPPNFAALIDTIYATMATTLVDHLS